MSVCASSPSRSTWSGCASSGSTARGSGSVLNPSVTASRSSNAPPGTISGRKTTTTSGLACSTARSIGPGSAPPRWSMNRAPGGTQEVKYWRWPMKATVIPDKRPTAPGYTRTGVTPTLRVTNSPYGGGKRGDLPQPRDTAPHQQGSLSGPTPLGHDRPREVRAQPDRGHAQPHIRRYDEHRLDDRVGEGCARGPATFANLQ